jgi:hypothetical protein
LTRHLVRNEAAKLFTSTYDNFIQTAGIRDGASHCAKILSVFYDNLDTASDPNDPEVIIKIDISNAFNTTCRVLTLDFLSGHASRDYACGLKRGDAIESTCEPLSKKNGYFHVMRTCDAKLRCFDWDGQVHLAKGKTGEQQVDPFERLVFNLTTLHYGDVRSQVDPFSDIADVLRHIIKNVSDRLSRNIQARYPVTQWEFFFFGNRFLRKPQKGQMSDGTSGDTTTFVQMQEIKRAFRALPFVTKLSPVRAHNGHGDGLVKV